MPLDLDQIRARNAFAAVRGVPPDRRGDTLILARKLPATLQTNGLLATWAYLLAKGKYGEVVAALRAHLRDPDIGMAALAGRLDRIFALATPPGPQADLAAHDLQRLTAEAIAFAVWVKRAAEAICDNGETAGEVAA